MCIAIATYKNRIASLLESSDKFVIIHSPSYDIKNSKSITICNNSPNELLQLLKSNNTKTLICGAISGYIRRLLEARNIEVIPWITGDIQSVIKAFCSDNLVSSSFIMPGCSQIGHHRRHRFRRGQ
jgi:predicted Fe-Mo cluster-binding NifX family protein